MKTLLLSLTSAFISFQFIVAQNNPPVAVADTIEAVAQVPLLIDAISNDYDPDGDTIFMHSVNVGISAEAHLEGQLIWYKPAYYVGEQHINYIIKDDQVPALQDNGSVVVNVLPNPDVPVAVADTFELVELIPHSINVLANDYDPNSDDFRIVDVSGVGYDCSVSINPDSLSLTVVTGTMNTNFWYQIQERTPQGYVSHIVTVQIIVLPNPDRPVAVNDTIIVTGGIPYDIPIMNNDYDPQGDAVEIYDIPGSAHHGGHGIYGNIIRYTSYLSYTGEDEFYYRIHEIDEPGIYSNWAKVKISVNKNPNCPVGEPDYASGMTGIPMIIDVLGNDHDPNGDALSIKSVSFGTITPDNKISYTSKFTTLESDSIFYRVMESANPESFSELTKVSIQLAVNPDLPVAVPDYVTTRAGVPVTIKPLENDIQNSNDTLIIRLVTWPQENPGFATYISDEVTYTPSFMAEGVQKVNYFIKADSGYAMAAMGIIYVNVLKQNYYDSLKVNNIAAGASASGNLFNIFYEMPGDLIAAHTDLFEGYYRVPASGPAHTIFFNSFQLGGHDQAGYLHMSAKYSDWIAGPISNVHDTLYLKRYARVWKLTKEEIEFHKQNYWKPDYEPIEAINSWPGNGFTNSGEALHLAPFYDVNADDNYIPDEGDYPLIRGDQCIFLMCNDDKTRTDTSALPMKAELHVMVYGYDEPTDTALFNTVFVHYDLINRSENNYTNCYAGVQTDFDIGYASDDRYRTDVQRASVFMYNGKDIDGDGQFWAYGDNPPAQSVTILAGPFMDTDGVDNPAGGCDESVNGINFGNGISDDERHGLSRGVRFERMIYSPWGYNELTLAGQYGYLNGLWDDGSPFLYGGAAHSTTGGVGPECRFTYTGDSDPLNWGTGCEFPNGGFNQNGKYWTEEQANNVEGDRRGLASMGPFTLAPGQVQEIELAYCTGLGNNGPMSSVDQLLRNIDSLRHAVAQGHLILPNSSLGIKATERPTLVNIYPNPASDLIVISNISGSGQAEYSIFNFYGSKVSQGSFVGNKPTIKVSHLSPGLYIIRVTDGKRVATGKFVKK